MKINHRILPALGAVLLLAGCGPTKDERDAAERARLELEEKQRQETEAANKAITTMSDKAFRQKTPEEEAAHQAEVRRQAQELIDAQKKADANPPKS